MRNIPSMTDGVPGMMPRPCPLRAVILPALLASACAAPPTPEPAPPLLAVPRVTVAESRTPHAVLDVAAVPGLNAAGRRSYERFLSYPAPRAFAIGDAGGLAWAASARDGRAAEEHALAKCRAVNAGRPCRVYARDQEVVWHGGPRGQGTTLTLSGEGWRLTSPPGFLRHGGNAEGAVIWTHGRGGDPRRTAAEEPLPAPLPFVQRFNNAGWDVWILARDPDRDVNYDAVLSFADASLRVAAQALRQAGYARVVAAGQSAGGWAALAALDTPGLLDGAIAIAGAGLYRPPSGQVGTLDFEALLSRVRDQEAAVVLAMFAGDHLLPWPQQSAALARAALARRVGPLVVIERPAGLIGHGAGAEPAFNDRYGACILHAVAARDATRCEPGPAPPQVAASPAG